MDLMLITETLLRDTDEDRAWCETSALNRGNFRLQNINRPNKRGGGIALVAKRDLNAKLIQSDQLSAMEYGIWTLRVGNTDMTIIGIYRLPTNDDFTVQNFINDFIELIGELRTTHKNFIILGDLNIRVNDGNDTEARQFLLPLEGLGLQQYVSFPTHKLGNTLDLIIGDTIGKIKIISARQGQFVSDDCVVLAVCNIPKKRNSGGSRISRRGRRPRGGAPTPEAATFRKICMSKRKNLDPGSANEEGN